MFMSSTTDEILCLIGAADWHRAACANRERIHRGFFRLAALISRRIGKKQDGPLEKIVAPVVDVLRTIKLRSVASKRVTVRTTDLVKDITQQLLTADDPGKGENDCYAELTRAALVSVLIASGKVEIDQDILFRFRKAHDALRALIANRT
jgi:MoxR-like ATPase